MIGDRLRMIARRHGDHADLALGRGERGELGERATLLERIGHLQIFVFDENVRSGQLRELARRQHGRAQDGTDDRQARGLDVRKSKGHYKFPQSTTRLSFPASGHVHLPLKTPRYTYASRYHVGIVGWAKLGPAKAGAKRAHAVKTSRVTRYRVGTAPCRRLYPPYNS